MPLCMGACVCVCRGDSDVYMSRQQTHGWVKHTAITHAPPGHVCRCVRAFMCPYIRVCALRWLTCEPPPLVRLLIGPPHHC